jgi:hypothetical protein
MVTGLGAAGRHLDDVDDIGRALRGTDNIDDGPRYVYRGGSNTQKNLTPRPGVDFDGLSTFDTPAGAAPRGGKVQVIDTSKLKLNGAYPSAPPPGHVSIRPPDPSQIPGWAATRNTGTVHPLTQDILSAIVREIRVR